MNAYNVRLEETSEGKIKIAWALKFRAAKGGGGTWVKVGVARLAKKLKIPVA